MDTIEIVEIVFHFKEGKVHWIGTGLYLCPQSERWWEYLGNLVVQDVCNALQQIGVYDDVKSFRVEGSTRRLQGPLAQKARHYLNAVQGGRQQRFEFTIEEAELYTLEGM